MGCSFIAFRIACSLGRAYDSDAGTSQSLTISAGKMPEQNTAGKCGLRCVWVASLLQGSLARQKTLLYGFDMSAMELLKQVGQELEKLPSADRAQFFDGVVSLEETFEAKESRAEGKALNWPDIHARHRRIFGNARLPENFVLAERQEEDQ